MKSRKIALFLFTIFTFTLLTACGSTVATPEATLDGYMTAWVNLDSAKMNEYFPSGNQEEIPDDDTYTNLPKRTKYTIGAAETDGDTATVKITITTLDMKTIMGEVISELMGQALSHMGDDSFDSEAYTNELLSKKMSAEDAPMTTKEVTAYLEKDTDGKWILSAEDKNTDFINALTGDLMTIADSFN